jgi:hypothetical protein
METFDSPGRILPVGSADQGIVSKKIADKDGQGQGLRQHPQKKVAPVPSPEKDEEERQAKDHVIDIIV